MNILIVNTYYFPNIIGGAEISVKKLAEGLVANGHEVHIICTDVKDDNEIINGVNVHRIKLSNIYQPIELRNKNILKKMIGRINDIYNMFNRKKLKEAILEISPDIMHVNNIYGISPAIWNLAKDMEIKLVHTIRDYYLMCPKISMLKENKICNKKNIVCKVFCNINRNISNKVDFVTAPSQYTLDTFINDGFFNLSKKEKVFNAIDFDQKMVREIYFSKNFNISNDKIIKFVFMGSLNKIKVLTCY
ncbi:glycosyltransferase [Clostridium pasteurianum]|uniref:glycosyltransferase n=1 Tax=Clostridium pasteurianum TaxID=1501 RepID=UPI0009776A02|nr:glycosyltransferase [Clostridium pasteurianum]